MGLGLKIWPTRKITHFTTSHNEQSYASQQKQITEVTPRSNWLRHIACLLSSGEFPPLNTATSPYCHSLFSTSPRWLSRCLPHDSWLFVPPAASSRRASRCRRECSQAPPVSRIETRRTLCFLQSPTVGKECACFRGEGRKDWGARGVSANSVMRTCVS